MEQYIQISKINDFLFCPRSLYLHTIYESFSKSVYHSKVQIAGTIAHKAVDEGRYSTHKRFLMALPVTSAEHGLTGKIDIFDTQTGELIERKRHLKRIHLGHKYQLYAQMLCLQEMGYEVKKMRLYSMLDNRTHVVFAPSNREQKEFFDTIERMRQIDAIAQLETNTTKCMQCIYRQLCRNDLKETI